ncbi:AAA family ATPase [Undibacterium sp. CY18W]|uniref:AAA family ATPase n=1 Tax=Undibacterium hunanense TaxID=2762292 RepID=A0ABR6ZTP7_9BURK|nr:AAA family ATPase [Undibacterium hunanense]MBC3919225.1 AAA family ATPase [Undibacterium hunanense]
MTVKVKTSKKPTKERTIKKENKSVGQQTEIIKFEPTKKMMLMTAEALTKISVPNRKKHWGKLILSNQTGMFYGPRGCGKTWLLMGIAISISSGVSFLDHHPFKQRRVIYLDGEMDISSFKDRLIMMCDSLDTPPPKNLSIFTPESFAGLMPSITDPVGQTQIDQMIGTEWDVVIVDNYSAWSGDGRETPEAFAPLAKWMLAHKHAGRCVIVVHHSGKKGGQRGSSRHEDALDWSVSLNPVDNKSTDGSLRIQMTWEKKRHLASDEALPITVVMAKSTKGELQWEYSRGHSVSAIASKIISMKANNMSSAEIANQLKIDRSTVNRHLKAAKSTMQ